jgi:long-chain acyl-CoA synthetase
MHVQGEYIAPEKLEGVFARSPLVAQAFVYGDSLKAQLVAVVVPDPDVLLPWAAERGMAKDMAQLCNDAAVAAAVLRSMQSEGQAAQLKGFEQVWPLWLADSFCSATRAASL